MALPNLPTAENELGAVTDLVDLVQAADINTLRRLIEALALKMPREFPAGGTNKITLDPDNGLVSFAADARPYDIINLPWYANISGTGGTTFTTQGESVNHIIAGNCTAGNTHGVLALPITLPPWVDVSADMRVIAYCQVASNTAAAGFALRVLVDRARAGQTSITEPTITETVHALPANAAGRIVKAYAGTLAGGTFTAEDHVAIGVQRAGDLVFSDTYTGAIRISRGLALEVRRKQV